jgi:hypothetical protein
VLHAIVTSLIKYLLQLDGFGHSTEGFGGDIGLLSLSLNTNEFNEDLTWNNDADNDTTTSSNTAAAAAVPVQAPAIAALAVAVAAEPAVSAHVASRSSSSGRHNTAVGASSSGSSGVGYNDITMMDRDSSTRAALKVCHTHTRFHSPYRV